MEDRGSGREELAEDRTDLAEDRTSMANERTFAGWARTAMAAIGIGLAFNALFNAMEPEWAPKAIATVFILLAIFLIYMAERRACAVSARLDTHAGKDLSSMNIRAIAIAIGFGAACLIAGIWLLV
jgi:putative membrane protein